MPGLFDAMRASTRRNAGTTHDVRDTHVRGTKSLIVVGVLVLACLVVGANVGQFVTLNTVQVQNVKHRALDEAWHIVETVPEIARTAETGTPTAAQAAFIDAVMEHSEVFAIAVFDASGTEVWSHRNVDRTKQQRLDTKSADAMQTTLATGEAQTVAEQTSGVFTEESLLSVAFLPLVNASGSTVGVLGVYLDHSRMASQAFDGFVRLSVLLSAVFTIAIAALFGAYLIVRRRAGQSGRQAAYLAHYDQLTGLHNRGGFHSALQAMRKKGFLFPARTAVLYFDLDNFKSVNDTRGHKAGDDILRHVGDAIRNCLGENDIACRFGGDEFVIVADTGSLSNAMSFAESVLEVIAQPVHTDSGTLLTGASCGIHFGLESKSIEEDIQRADLALYQAKLDGRNICRVFTPELEARMNRRLKVERAVNHGLSDRLFSLNYQPLIHRESGKCVGFEALLRLTDTDGEAISPAEFIPIAEANGAIRKIGAWVLDTAVAEAARWPENLFVSVNLSARQFDNDNLVEMVKNTLAAHWLDPHRLELEVTESLLIANSDSVGTQLMDLRALGVTISMDDFGTGYSSLGYLWKYGFDKLKIDRSFILGLESDAARAREILDTIIVLGHRLNMKVTAEGIETASQARMLSELSCDQFQGYLYGRPMPPSDLAAYILRNEFEIVSVAETPSLLSTS